MVGRVLLGIVAALWAVLIPGEAGFVVSTPLEWPRRERREHPAYARAVA